MSFLDRLKEIFNNIPIKTKFLRDLGFNNSYSGFRYFMQGRKEEPSEKLMEKLCENMGYHLITIPVKDSEETKSTVTSLENAFFNDLQNYLKKYENDQKRNYVKNYGKESSVASAIESFSNEESHTDAKKIDISDLF